MIAKITLTEVFPKASVTDNVKGNVFDGGMEINQF